MRRGAYLVGWLCAAPLGCGGEARHTDVLALEAKRPSEDPVVATVDGRTIGVSDLRAAARGGETPRQTLERLLEAEVLVGEAAARRIGEAPEVQTVARQALVQRLLRDFEGRHDKQAIPTHELKAAYEGRKQYFVHGDMAQVWHLLVPSRSDDTAGHETKRRIAAQVQARAAKVTSLDEFKALAKEIRQPDGSPLILEEVIADPETVDKKFVRASVALQKAGDVSSVIETEFGFHVIWLVRQLPAQNRSFADAEAELRDKLALDYRVRSFAQYVEELLRQHRIEKHDAVLAARLAPPSPPNAGPSTAPGKERR